jgi:cytochrome b involved in lipid metabolism
MNKKIIWIVLIILIVIGALVIGMKNSSSTENKVIDNTNTSTDNSSISTNPSDTKSDTSTTNNTSTTEKKYTLADIAKHKTSSDCWTTVNGGVYDLTSFVNKHPGGVDNIVKVCGIDGSTLFGDQHGGERRPANELSSLKIGILSKVDSQ